MSQPAPNGTAPENAGLGPITVAICNYDGEQHLPHCLDAVRALEGEVAEVVLVDNASRDRSLELVRERYPEVRIVALEQNGGPTVARNAGLRAAHTRWVLALDNDAVCAPDALRLLAEAVATRPDVAIAQPRSVFDGERDRVHYDGGSFHYAGLISLRNFYRPLAEAGGEGVVRVDCVVSVALLMHRERVLELGGYDEGYFILFEDSDLSWRVRTAGLGIVSVEDALVRHREGTAGVSYREGPSYPRRRAFYHSYNRWRYITKSLRWRTLFCCAPGLVVYEVAWFAFTLAGGNAGAWFAGKARFVRELPGILRARREVQGRRTVRDRELLVGGPLTTIPLVAQGGGKRVALALLDWVLRGWWCLARPFCG